MESDIVTLDPMELKDMIYFIPCPKSPHGCDTDPTGEYIVASGKLAAIIPVFSFSKIQKAIANKEFEGAFAGIPVIKYESALHGEVKKPGLGPLHTEFDEKGNAYTLIMDNTEASTPKYDLKEQINLHELFPVVGIEPIKALEPTVPVTVINNSNNWIIWLGIGLAVIILCFFTYKLVREIN